MKTLCNAIGNGLLWIICIAVSNLTILGCVTATGYRLEDGHFVRMDPFVRVVSMLLWMQTSIYVAVACTAAVVAVLAIRYWRLRR